MKQLRMAFLTTFIVALTVCGALAGNRAIQVESLLTGIKDSSGKALTGGKVYTYAAGTSTLKTAWTDAGKTTPAANPITLDAAGKATLYADGMYKFIIKDSFGVTVATLDNLKYRFPSTNVVTRIGNYTATLDDDVVLVDASAGAVTVVMPDATLATSPCSVKKIDGSANAITIQTQLGQTIDGASSMLLSTTGDSTTLYSDGTTWRGLNKIVTASSATNADHAQVADKADSLKDNNGTYRSLNSGAVANTVALRDASGNLPGNILGAAASATTASNADNADKVDNFQTTQTGAASSVMVTNASGGLSFQTATTDQLLFGTTSLGRLRYDTTNNKMEFVTNGAVSAMIDAGGNVGVSTTPPAWAAGHKAINISTYGALSAQTNGEGAVALSWNAYGTSASGAPTWAYRNTGDVAKLMEISTGGLYFRHAPTGTAGNPIAWTDDVIIDSTGNLLVGVASSSAGKMQVNGEIYAGTSGAQKVWHQGNDGAGSGLDADTLDTKHASDFLGTTAKAADADKLDGAHWITLVDSSASLAGNASQLVNLRVGGAYHFYRISAYTNIPGTGVGEYYGGTDLGAWAYIVKGASGTNDQLHLLNNTAGALTIYYRVDVWE